MSTAARFIWTQRALEKWTRGVPDPAHTISAPNITECYEGFVNQLRPGTPWMLVDGEDILDSWHRTQVTV